MMRYAPSVPDRIPNKFPHDEAATASHATASGAAGTSPPSAAAELLDFLTLRLADGVGPTIFARAIARFGTPARALAATPSQLATLDRIGPATAERIRRSFDDARDQARRTLDRCAELSIDLITLRSPRYPPTLRLIPDPPPLLFARGTLPTAPEPAVAIVGSRRATHYGVEQAERFAAAFAQHQQLAVVSGGARGIDTAAHRATIRAGGRTVVVLGAGHASPYPPENEPLFASALDRGGAVLSELPPDTPPAKENFPTRNRIIAGLAIAVLVIEAPKRSGALITARLAVEEHNRDALAIPGRVDSDASAGTNHLIRTGGAGMVTSPIEAADALAAAAQQLLTAAAEAAAEHADAADDAASPAGIATTHPSTDTDGPAATLAAARPAAPAALHNPADIAQLSDIQQRILASLDGPTSWDDLSRRTGLDAATLRAQATLLEIRGLATRTGPGLDRRHPHTA